MAEFKKAALRYVFEGRLFFGGDLVGGCCQRSMLIVSLWPEQQHRLEQG
ncbi:hypothetical protein ACLIKD_08515 [Azonexus sp. IMCC34842]